MPKLTIELVPQSVWEKNLRSLLSKSEWDQLRRYCYRKAGYKCEVCGGRGPKHPVECHELWSFDDENNIQTLNGLIALCPTCHSVKHIGFASITGRKEAAMNQLKKVNGWDDYEADDYVAACFQVWNERNREDWTINIDWALDKLKEL